MLLAGLWLGGMAAVGLIGAPTAFALIPHKLAAAAVASRMFYLMALAGAVLGAVLLVIERNRSSGMTTPLLLVMGGLFWDVLGEFVIVPQLLAAAAAHAAVAANWHIAASAAYGAQALCVLVYVWMLPSQLGRDPEPVAVAAGAADT
jgi:hypothetical protein